MPSSEDYWDWEESRREAREAGRQAARDGKDRQADQPILHKLDWCIAFDNEMKKIALSKIKFPLSE